jgi:putative addiction module component (TIGR02574 family)
MNPALASEINRLTPAEKLRLIENIWDTLALDPDQLPLPEWHKQALDEAQEAYTANPDAGSPWPEVKARITRKT